MRKPQQLVQEAQCTAEVQGYLDAHRFRLAQGRGMQAAAKMQRGEMVAAARL
jgi:hypothetical protein